jgi:hypothetical protein
MGMGFSGDTEVSRAAAIKCFEIPSRGTREASQSLYCPSPGLTSLHPLPGFIFCPRGTFDRIFVLAAIHACLSIWPAFTSARRSSDI